MLQRASGGNRGASPNRFTDPTARTGAQHGRGGVRQDTSLTVAPIVFAGKHENRRRNGSNENEMTMVRRRRGNDKVDFLLEMAPRELWVRLSQ